VAHLSALPTVSCARPLSAPARAALFLALAAWICLRPEGDLFRDDVWILRVVDRILSGDVLYRDVSFGVPPLSAYAMAALAAVFGSELLVVRAVVAIAFCLALWWSLQSARLLGADLSAAVAAGLVAVAIPSSSSGYSMLAAAFMTGCFACALRWQNSGLLRGAAAAGAFAGLALASKHTIGALSFAALAVSIAAARFGRRERVRALSWSAAACAASALVWLIPVAASGGLPKFIEYGFTGKGAYLSRGGMSYLANLGLRQDVAEYLRAPVFLLPAVLFFLARIWLRAVPAEKPRAAAAFAFCLAAFAGVYPRADWWHLQTQLPILAAGLAYALRGRWPAPSRVRTALALFLAAVAAAALAKPYAVAALSGYEFAALPHFSGILLPPGSAQAIRSAGASLRAAVPSGDVFLLMAGGSVFYLTGSAQNPTPFDYPYATTMGLRGEDELISAIDAGRLRYVCLGPGLEWLMPARLIRHVQSAMTAGPGPGFCVLYRGKGSRRPE
jgi:hypothetical protein